MRQSARIAVATASGVRLAVAAEHPLALGELAPRQHEEAGAAQELVVDGEARSRGRPVAAFVGVELLVLELVLVLVLERRLAVRSWSRTSSGSSTSSGCSSSSRSRISSSSSSVARPASWPRSTGATSGAAAMSASSSTSSARRRPRRPRGRRHPRGRRASSRSCSSRSSSSSSVSSSSKSSSLIGLQLAGVAEGRPRCARDRRVLGAGAAEYNAGRPTCCQRASARAFPARSAPAGDGQKTGPRRPLGPLFGPACPGRRVIPAFSTWSPGPPTPSHRPFRTAPRHRHRKTHDRYHGAGMRM